MMPVLTELEYSGLDANMVLHAFKDLHVEGWSCDTQTSRIPDHVKINYEVMKPMKPGANDLGSNKTTTVANAMLDGI